MIMISLIHHSGRVKSVMVFIFGCHVIRVPNKAERPRQKPQNQKKKTFKFLCHFLILYVVIS